MEKIKTEGQCFYCEKMFAGAGISRHLSAHLKEAEKENPAKSKAYHLKITGWKYFLHVLMNEKRTLGELDDFLRNIWLECCGHMSSFEIKGKPRNSGSFFDFDESSFGEDQDTAIAKTLKKDMILNYEYDFGSTTQLEIKVMGEYQIAAPKEILLLSRNEPLKIICDICKKEPAEVICMLWHDGESHFCNSCKKIHAKKCSDFAEYCEIDLVNSPRTGVCAYDAGQIDTERDGVWKKGTKG